MIWKTWDEVDASAPLEGVSHQITYWLHDRVTLEQWIELDDLFDEAFSKVLGATAVVTGFAGPIPFAEAT